MAYVLSFSLLGLTFYATGYLAHQVLRGLSIPALGTTLVRLTLGLAIWIWVLFGLASVGAYRAEVALPLAAAAIMSAAVLAVPLLRQRLHALRARGDLPRSQERWPVRLARLLSILPASVTLLALAALALSPFIGWDDDVYHLTLPKLYLAHGGFRPVAFNVYSHWPHGVELLYGLAMMLHDYLLAKWIHTGFLALLVAAVFRVCSHHGSRVAAFAASGLLLGNHVVLAEAERAYVDIASAFFFLVAVAAADEHLRSRRLSALALAGIACGALAATKLTGPVGAVCIALLLGLTSTPGVQRTRWATAALVLGAPVLLFAVPWYVKSYLYTGNPVYPLLYDWFGGIEWSAEVGKDFARWHRRIGAGRSFFDYLALPYRVATQGGDSYDRFGESVSSFWVAAVPFTLLLLRYAPAARSYVLCAVFYFVVWALGSQQIRFLIPILPLLAIAAALAADRAIGLVRERAARVRLFAALAACAWFGALPALSPFLSGGLSAARRLQRKGVADRSSAVPEGYAYLNEHTPQAAKVLLLHTNLGFFLEREYIADSFFEASQLRWLFAQASSMRALHTQLEELGITHVYVAKERWGLRFPKLLTRLLADKRSARQVYRCRRERCTIYELRRKKDPPRAAPRAR
jgi:hypothetical protein